LIKNMMLRKIYMLGTFFPNQPQHPSTSQRGKYTCLARFFLIFTRYSPEILHEYSSVEYGVFSSYKIYIGIHIFTRKSTQYHVSEPSLTFQNVFCYGADYFCA
jgi:hypothetical protein